MKSTNLLRTNKLDIKKIRYPTMETDQNEAKSPVLVIKVILATICMFGAFTGFLLSIWKDNYYAVPGCLILELVCVGSIYYLVSAVTLKQGFYPEKDGFYFALLPCGLANVFSLCGWSTIPENS
ncbi:hypothetical protein CEXT_307281 [Caerostris extrusa]|uniref:Transmembrane protein n=1 Tax=Caerostris extrusa TaxID=172846 RepID=A0AAV4WZ58_CAEEX|nr:hypothetical protein CEXT_307281 [Caerostris extrusa]